MKQESKSWLTQVVSPTLTGTPMPAWEMIEADVPPEMRNELLSPESLEGLDPSLQDLLMEHLDEVLETPLAELIHAQVPESHSSPGPPEG